MQQEFQHIGLAPMEGTTDFPTRLWFQLTSCPSWSGTPFLRITETYPRGLRWINDVWPELTLARGLVKYGLVPQLMASSPKRFGEVAAGILSYSEVIELNCGCPAPRVVGNGAGSSLLRDAEAYHHVLTEISNRLPVEQLSVKIRTGFADTSDYEELLTAKAQFSLNRVVIHGRTRFQSYAGWADWQLVQRATELLTVPVLGSGDITDAATCLERKRLAPGVCGAIVGRGALRNPWIFEELRTGLPLKLEKVAILYSIAVFALLQHSKRNCPNKLFDLISKGFFLEYLCITDAELWRHIYEMLAVQVWGKVRSFDQLDFDRVVLGRAKMMWNYLRSALNPKAMDRRILRQSNFGDFLRGVAHILDEEECLCYQPRHDWIYSGQAMMKNAR